MVARATHSLKRSYRCVQSLQQFYSGGPFAISPDGSFLACGCGEEIKIVDSSTAAVRRTLEGDSEAVTAITISSDGRLLYSAGHSRLIRVWDIPSWKCLRSWKGHDGPVMGMACHASGGLLATAGADKRVCVWDVDGGFCTHFFKGHEGVVTNVMFHNDPNNLLLFSGSDDACVRIWNLQSKKCVTVLKEHFSPVTSLALSEDGNTLLSASRDKVVNVWDLHDYSLKTVPTYEMVESICVIPAGTCFSTLVSNLSTRKRKSKTSIPIHFLTVGERGVVRIWSSEGAVCLYEQRSSDETPSSDESRRGFRSAVMLPSDQGLICVTADQQFLFYSAMKSSEETSQLNLYRRLVGYNEEVLDMRFLGEEEQYLAVATNQEQVRVYEVSSMSCSYVLAGHTDTVVCLDSCISSLGSALLVTGSKDNTVRVWDVESKNCIGIGKNNMGAVGAVAFSRKHRNFFVSGSCERMIRVWSLDGVSDAYHESTLKVKAFVAAHDKDINSLAVAPNDSLLCSGSEDRTACIWRLPDLVSLHVLKGHKRGIWSVEFSPVDQCVMTSSGDKTIKIWAISDGSCLRTFEGHNSSVLRAAFLTRGTQLISCGGDGLVKLWTVKASECIATYDQHEGKVWALAVGKKTEMLATGGTDATINMWHDCTAADKEEAFHKEEEAILRGQELENAVTDSDYTKAIQLAFELRRPHKLLDLFSVTFRSGGDGDPIGKAISALGKDELRVLLEYIREWNTKPKFCHVAQFILSRFFKIFPPEEILEIKGIGELIEGILPYSKRHFTRMDRHVRNTFLLDYTLTQMKVLEPETSVFSSKTHPRLHQEEDGHPRNASPKENGSTNNSLSDNNIKVPTALASEVSEPASLKKRKSSKSKKKQRDVTLISV
ncbi:transducin beta-like protein 3 [Dioscorea cayenensis subsp. rotundata]|uniref:Transducin beta-like protein 3 n=1 Tax=Dioscorea cayennensis subsp. rotundata TaxID=55577 RepID=A0AB40CPY7_DIOCR|nr:transducin beta-like protein 3 [Dioscorea cayenensis subsp. rotundata]